MRVDKIASKDISQYLRSEYQYTSIYDGKDSWVATPVYLFTKESRLLNKQLGVSKINKQQNIENITKRK